MIRWQEIKDSQSSYLPPALALYAATFPPEVLEPTDVLVRGIELQGEVAPNAYHFLIGTDESDRVVALSTAHYLADVNVGFVVYLMVDPAVRSSGLGTELLAQMEGLLEQDAQRLGQTLRGVVLETEREEDMHGEAEKADSVRRFQFFKRNGYRQLEGLYYVQPPLQPISEEIVPLHLFMKMYAFEEFTSHEELRQIVWAMYQEKYGRMNGIDLAVLRECHQLFGVPQQTLEIKKGL